MVIIDACNLGQALISGIKNSEELKQVLKSYEDKIIPHGWTNVLESRQTADAKAEGFDIWGGRLQGKFVSLVVDITRLLICGKLGK